MLKRTALLLMVALAVPATGCNRPDFTRPESAYISLARALQKGDVKTAWNAVSTGTRTRLEERAKAISAGSGGSLREEPAALFFGGSEVARPLKEVKLLREEGNVATLSVVPEDGPPREVRMVKEKDGWKLDVSQDLQEQVAP
ncbi:MAG: hypothetical protein WBV82_24380 [Myxococcaceae bacterium]